MKKIGMMGLALVCFAACVRGPEEDLPRQANITLIAQTESPAETRTLVAETGGETTAKVLWEPGDSFMAFSGSQRGEFYSRIEEPCETAEFQGYFENGPWVAGMDLWALYPQNWDASFEDGVITTDLPARQMAQPGSFGREMNLAIAHTTSGTIQFYNVGGGVRFSVQEDGIREVILQGMDGEVLAGKISVGFQNEVPAVLDVKEGKHAISLVPAYYDGSDRIFQKDVWYYFVALPGALEKGFVLDFFKENEHGGRVFDKSVTIRRSIYGTVTRADEGVRYTACPDGVITFKDAQVKSILVKHFDIDDDGAISVREAAIVRSFLVNKSDTRADEGKVSIFAGTGITSFDELVYFTSLTRIEDGAFAGCESLKSVTIPETVTAIGDNAFNGCTGLKTILVLSSTPSAIGTDAFANSGDCPISVPEDVVDQYVSAWSAYAPRIKAAEEPVCPTPEMVDLGLPSGTKWASFNLGASKPEEYGDYYAWGETKTKSVFSWSTYKWYKIEGGSEGLTKYCPDSDLGFKGFQDGKWLLEPEDDAAHVRLGEGWRMPTAGEWDELARLCTLEWVSLGGVDCAKLTGPNGNSIILPPGGGAGEDADESVGEIGVFWSSSGVNADEVGAWIFGFQKDLEEEDYEFSYPGRCLLTEPDVERSMGMPIRPVSGPAPVFAESVSLDKTEISLKPGESITLQASILPSNTTHQALLWISADDRVATVSATGEVKAVGVGETPVYAIIMDGFKAAECTVKVGFPEAVDLGLPSGIKWASYNLGGPLGDYYAWGESRPYYKAGGAQSDAPEWQYNKWYSDGEMDGYGWKAYQYAYDYNEYEGGGNSFKLNKYYDSNNGYWQNGDGDGKTVLDPEDDAAHELLGGDWRLPSWAEINELRALCNWEWTTEEGVSGYKVTGPNANSIFLPAPGVRNKLNLEGLGTYGYYWTSSRHPSQNYAISLGFNADRISTNGYARYYGFTIRPVQGTVPVPVEQVSLNTTEMNLYVGESATFRASIAPENATFPDLAWTYSTGNPDAFSLEQDGNSLTVKALSPGFLFIQVISQDGGKMATCQVHIMNPADDSAVSSSSARPKQVRPVEVRSLLAGDGLEELVNDRVERR